MKRVLSHIVLTALLLTGVAACDRNSGERDHANGTSPPQTVPSKTEETTSRATDTAAIPASEPAASAVSETSPSTARRGALSGAGADVCGEWNLTGETLARCRREWMDAQSDADRLRIRNAYEPQADGKQARETPFNRQPEALNNASFCDQLKLRDADLSECRAQWKAAKTDGDLVRVRARYEALSSNGAGSRKDSSSSRE